MLDARALIEKHRAKGVLVDTNLLVLLLVGLVNTERIRNFKRTQNFTVNDFRLLAKLVGWFGAPLIATPHILSQVSDLTDLPGQERVSIRELFKSTIELIEEQYDSARELVRNPLFERFGLGDASIASVCERNVLVLTADLQLQIALEILGPGRTQFQPRAPTAMVILALGGWDGHDARAKGQSVKPRRGSDIYSHRG